MTDRIKSWLNDEVQLSKKIKNFEKDFANGYYFGELLQKYNQQLNFGDFVNSDTKNVIVKNFTQLYQTFTSLGIKIDTNIAYNIIQKRPHESEKMLLQLKMGLEKVINPGEAQNNQKQTQYNSSIPFKILKHPKIHFDKFQLKNFEDRLNKMLKPQKQIDMDMKLERFNIQQLKQEQKAFQQEQQSLQEEQDIKQEIRNIQVNKMNRAREFSEKWKNSGEENWQKNIDIKKTRELNDLKFKQKQQYQKDKLIEEKRTKNQNDLLQNIRNFEANIIKNGFGRKSQPDEEVDSDADSVDRLRLETSTKAQQNTYQYYDKKRSDLTTKEKDKRRRKMIVEQNKMQKQLEVAKREQLVLQKLKQQSRQEKEIEYEI